MADFFQRTKLLADMVGDGNLTGVFAADKVYAANMHEKGWRNFLGYLGPKEIERYHRGGGPKFVENAIKEGWPELMEDLADGVLDGTIRERMENAMKYLDSELQRRAPIESGDLRNSGTYTVYDSGTPVAHKPSGTTYEAR